MNSKTHELLKAGVSLCLTPDGRELLAKIISEGCPVKFIRGNFVPIECPFTHTATKFSCQDCWKKWLKEFIEEDL